MDDFSRFVMTMLFGPQPNALKPGPGPVDYAPRQVLKLGPGPVGYAPRPVPGIGGPVPSPGMGYGAPMPVQAEDQSFVAPSFYGGGQADPVSLLLASWLN